MKAWPTILIAILAGCTMGPDYRRPETPPAEAFRETPEPWKLAQPRDDIARGNWWEIFGDPQLNDLITKIDVSNQTLAASEAQFRQTLAALGISIIGGLVLSQLLTLYTTPVVYLALDRLRLRFTRQPAAQDAA